MSTLTASKSAQIDPNSGQALLAEQTHLQDAIHAPHQKQRDRILEVLADSGDARLIKQAVTMSQCASSLHLYFNEEQGTVREYVHTCKARLCPLCGRRRSQHVAGQMIPMVESMKKPRHLVLTTKSRPAGLREQIADLVRWFTKLRRTPFWRKNVVQGVYTIEATVNERSGLWHPHLHIIFDGEYLPVKRLQYLWHEITGGSEIVWIEEAYSVPGLCNELCKYIGKPQKSEHWTDEKLREYAIAIRGTRMVQTFGKRKPAAINDENPPDEKPQGEESISLSRLLWLAGRDNAAAVHALPLLALKSKHMARYIYAMMPQLMPDLTPAERLLQAYAIIDAGKAPPGEKPAEGKQETKDLDKRIVRYLALAAQSPDGAWGPAGQTDPQKWTGY